ncbi:DNA polymerase III, epsilon subunit [Longilinea arvoryzae]|uniref:DNA polymerase III, epsilon subunit n=1 Tax=Longilinea arvoryzae TaxID=360412 RepID=A0A0S7BMQ9_9CHLR|nr:3'-5' exonuclease [Longilinea arvoryzae]GAP15018.1 DNA polymerase III, epsilon subunit [Longilinea arvoryzae]
MTSIPDSPIRQQIARFIRQKINEGPLYLDTETTGLDREAEIVEIAIVDTHGQILQQSFVKPSRPIPADATAINGITNEMVQGAPSWPVLWQSLRGLLNSHPLGLYNADYDLRLMQQSMTIYRLPWRETFNAVDVMKVYSDFRGEWDPYRRGKKIFKLEEAGKFFNIPLPNAHRAAADTLLTRAVFHCMAGLEY